MPSATKRCLDAITANRAKSAVIVEFFGTFLTVMTLPLCTMTNEEVSPLSIGAMLMGMGFCFGYLSGAHFNPAVTIGVYFSGLDNDFGFVKMVLYILAQLAGAFGAVFLVFLMKGFDFPAPEVPFDIQILRLILTEVIFTFLIVSAILHVSSSRQRHTPAYGFALGMPMTAAMLCVGGLHGGTFNPASATSLLVVKCIFGQCRPLLRIWAYWAAEVGAALLAALVFRATVDASLPAATNRNRREASYGSSAIATQ